MQATKKWVHCSNKGRMGCKRKPEKGDDDFCQRAVVSGPYSKGTERQFSTGPHFLQVTEILAVINTCQDFSLFTVKSSRWGFMPAESAGKIFRVLEKGAPEDTVSLWSPVFCFCISSDACQLKGALADCPCKFQSCL